MMRLVSNESPLTKKGMLRQINISKSQIEKDAFTIKSRISHLSIEDAKAAKQLKQTQELVNKIKKNRENRESKVEVQKELMQ